MQLTAILCVIAGEHLFPTEKIIGSIFFIAGLWIFYKIFKTKTK